MTLLSIAPINELKLVMLVVLVAAPILSGGVAGWGQQSGRLARLGGLAVGLLVGMVSGAVVVVMLYSHDSNCRCDNGLRLTFGTDPTLTGPISGMWLVLYPAKLAAAAITTWVVTTWVLRRRGLVWAALNRSASSGWALASPWASWLGRTASNTPLEGPQRTVSASAPSNGGPTPPKYRSRRPTSHTCYASPTIPSLSP